MSYHQECCVVDTPLALLVPSPEANACLSESTARRLCVVPIALIYSGNRRVLVLACSNPADSTQVERLQRSLPSDLSTRLLPADQSDIAQAIDKCYKRALLFQVLVARCRTAQGALDVLADQSDYLTDLIESSLRKACRVGASDMHISPERDSVLFRHRVDGVLANIARVSLVVLPRLMVRLKVISSLDIAETRQPQDGQFSLLIDAKLVEFRISTFPTLSGENTVIRVLDHQEKNHSLAAFKLPVFQLEQIKNALLRPDGLVLVCGPTGSGKSTTLYAMLAELDSSSLNIMTLEDPVERPLSGVRQCNIKPNQSLDYAQGVRALLRQDPDVLLIGEIRDSQSCKMAMRAVMTGHQVFASVHANDVFGALDRLLELGASRELLTSHLVAIAAQRLIRKRCTACLESRNTLACNKCQGAGYQGRQIIMELLIVTPQNQKLISEKRSLSNLFFEKECSFDSLRVRAHALLRAGITDVNEVTRVLGPDLSRATANTELKAGT